MHLSVDRVRLQFAGVAGQEHRVRRIARRAVELLHRRLREEPGAAGLRPDSRSLDALAVPTLHLNLGILSDDRVAEALANAMYAALRGSRQEG